MKGGVHMKRKFTQGLTFLLLCTLLFLLPFNAVAASGTVGEYNPSKPENLLPQHLRGESALVMDAETGEILFEKNANDIRYPASTTKIMTVYLGILFGNLDQTVTVSETCLQLPEDASRIPLEAGQEISFKDLLCATMVASGNEGANLIAEVIAGSVPAFANMMNLKAQELGCTSTHFVNPHGLHDDNQVSTAKDLAIIAAAAMQDETFREIAGLHQFTVPPNNVNQGKTLYARDSAFKTQSSNEDRKQYYFEYSTGVKTGFTTPAGYCYVASAQKDGQNLISVTLKATSYNRTFLDSKRLLLYGFSQYTSTSITEIYKQNPKVVDISSFALDDSNMGRLELLIRKQDPLADDQLSGRIGGDLSYLAIYNTRTSFRFTRRLEAPIVAGDVIGEMTYTPQDGGQTIIYELVASRNINRRDAIAPSLEEIFAFAQSDPNPFPPLSLELILIVLLPIIVVILFFKFIISLFKRRRRKARRSRRSSFRRALSLSKRGNRYFR